MVAIKKEWTMNKQQRLYYDKTAAQKEALLAYLYAYLTPQRRARMQHVLAFRTNYLTVVMEDTVQSHNANAVIRTAESLGVQNLHVIEQNHSFAADNTIAMGACNWLNIASYRTTVSALAALKADGYRIVATVPREHAATPNTLPLHTGKIALLFGTEQQGLSAESCALADEFLYIPMFGFTQSFNVSVSVALCLQPLITRLHASDIAWQLTADEQRDLLLDWMYESVRAAPQLTKQFFDQ